MDARAGVGTRVRRSRRSGLARAGGALLLAFAILPALARAEVITPHQVTPSVLTPHVVSPPPASPPSASPPAAGVESAPEEPPPSTSPDKTPGSSQGTSCAPEGQCAPPDPPPTTDPPPTKPPPIDTSPKFVERIFGPLVCPFYLAFQSNVRAYLRPLELTYAGLNAADLREMFPGAYDSMENSNIGVSRWCFTFRDP